MNGYSRLCCLPICQDLLNGISLHNGGRLETHRWPMMKLTSEGSLGVDVPQVGSLTTRRRIGLSEPGVVVSGLTWVLGTKLKSSERTACTSNH